MVCQEYTMKVLDTVVKVKLYESKEEGLYVSFGFAFQCSTQIIVHAKNQLFTLSRPRFDLKLYSNTVQKTEGPLSRQV